MPDPARPCRTILFRDLRREPRRPAACLPRFCDSLQATYRLAAGFTVPRQRQGINQAVNQTDRESDRQGMKTFVQEVTQGIEACFEGGRQRGRRRWQGRCGLAANPRSSCASPAPKQGMCNKVSQPVAAASGRQGLAGGLSSATRNTGWHACRAMHAVPCCVLCAPSAGTWSGQHRGAGGQQGLADSPRVAGGDEHAGDGGAGGDARLVGTSDQLYQQAAAGGGVQSSR